MNKQGLWRISPVPVSLLLSASCKLTPGALRLQCSCQRNGAAIHTLLLCSGRGWPCRLFSHPYHLCGFCSEMTSGLSSAQRVPDVPGNREGTERGGHLPRLTQSDGGQAGPALLIDPSRRAAPKLPVKVKKKKKGLQEGAIIQ